MSVELPKDWKSVKLGEVCNIQTGKYDANHAKPKGKYRFYTCAFEFMYCDTNRFKGESLILPGNGANVGEVFYYNGEFDAYQRTYVLNEIKSFPKYLYYHLLGNWKRKNQDKQFGSATNYIRMGNFTDYELPLPPKPTQLAIVCKIEELFSEIENGIQSLFTAKEQLKKYRQSVLKWAFEGKLTNGLNCELYDLLDEDDLSIAAEPETDYRVGGNHNNQKNPKNDSSDEGELPEGWKWVKIKDEADTFGGYAFKSAEFRSEGKYQVLRMGNIRPGILRYEESPVFLDQADDTVLSRSLLKINDVIITQTGTRKKRDYGFTVLIPKSHLLLNQRIAAIRFKERYLPKFFLYFSWTDSFKDQFFANETGNVGQGNVGMKAVTETLIPFCSLEEQKSIVQAIESRLSVADKMEESITESLQQAEALKLSILKKAFEGRL